MNLKEIAICELEQSAHQTLERIRQLRTSKHWEEIEDIEAELFAPMLESYKPKPTA